jgi:hypothetical protein
MININNTCNKGEEIKLIIRSLLIDMMTKVLWIRQHHRMGIFLSPQLGRFEPDLLV